MASLVHLVGCCIVVLAFLEGETTATVVHKVGDKYGWAVPPNGSLDFYDKWARNKTFEIGDLVVFKLKGNHTVSEVSKEYYDNCTKTQPYYSSPMLLPIPLKENGTRYFICNIGTNCEQGQKVAIKVGGSVSALSLTAVCAVSLALQTLVFYFLIYYA